MNNSTANLLSISCLNWGVQPNYGAALYALCPATSAINDNGTLQSATFKAGGPGYPQFLVINQSFNYDKLKRLTSASDSGGWSRTFNYGQTGNMWVTNPVGRPLTKSLRAYGAPAFVSKFGRTTLIKPRKEQNRRIATYTKFGKLPVVGQHADHERLHQQPYQRGKL